MVSQIKEDEIEGRLPKLKRIILNPNEEYSWSEVKRAFAKTKDIWKNVSPMEEVEEDYNDRQEFKQFEFVLKEKLDNDARMNRELALRLEELENTYHLLDKEEVTSGNDAVTLKAKTGNLEEENAKVILNIKNIEAAIALQEKIFAEYNERITTKKNEFDRFRTKIETHQSKFIKRLEEIDKELAILRSLQEEIAFMYNARAHKFQKNTEFLNYVSKNFGKASVEDMKKQLHLSKMTKAEEEEFKAKEEKEKNEAQGTINDLEPVNLKAFKDIMRTVLKEGGNKSIL